MFENEKNIPMCEEGNAAFTFQQFQIKKKELAEQSLKKSEIILNFLVGCRNEVPKCEEKENITCFKEDLLSENETLKKLYDNLSCILNWLGA